MTSFDDLDAPQFSTFDDADQEEVETYFQIDHESIRSKNKLQNINQQQQNFDGDFYSVLSSVSPSSSTSSVKSDALELRSRNIRRSMSSGNIPLPVQIPVASDKNKKKNEESSVSMNGKYNKHNASKVNGGFQYGKLVKGRSESQSRLKACSQDSLNRLAAPKHHHSSTGNLASSPQSYVSVAEAVKRFQERTPQRFHTTNKNKAGPLNCPSLKLKHTIPYSPKLMTKTRVKTNSNQVMTHDQRELKEFEEAQKFKIKANPVNKRILQQPLKAIHHLESKPVTVPQPFNITQVSKTAPSPKKEEYQFHARPVPKSVLEPKMPPQLPTKVTKPVTPTFVRKIPKASPLKRSVERPTASSTLTKTKPVPFSFDKRDILMVKRKEEHVKKLKEEEKKAREFHAKPIPKSIEKIIEKQKKLNGSNASSSSNASDSKKSSEDVRETFKARPPTVLYQKPFEPKKLNQPLVEIQPFQLNSELRAREREIFEMKKREQLEKTAEILRKEEEERVRKEQEEIKVLRKETAFKAQPIRNYKELAIKPSGKLTIPISPVFTSGKKDKENIGQEF